MFRFSWVGRSFLNLAFWFSGVQDLYSPMQVVHPTDMELLIYKVFPKHGNKIGLPFLGLLISFRYKFLFFKPWNWFKIKWINPPFTHVHGSRLIGPAVGGVVLRRINRELVVSWCVGETGLLGKSQCLSLVKSSVSVQSLEMVVVC